MKEYSQEAVDLQVTEALDALKTPNVLLCGQTGVGKSSAVNFLFRDEITTVGHGEPCTQGMKLFKSDFINIYDSEGYEIGGTSQVHYEKLLFDDFLEKKQGVADTEAVHLVWYAISGAGLRYTDLDIKLIKRIVEAKFPVCILLTKIDEMDVEQLDEMYKKIKDNLNNIEVFKLSTKKDEVVQKYCDWEKLIDWSYKMLPEIFKDRFVSGLKAGLEEKQKQANKAIAVAVTAAIATGASPIPFSDAALLIPVQTIMVIKIIGLYGITLKNGAVASIISDTIMTTIGKKVAGSLLKLIPGVGSVIGGAINATIAGTLTGALGKTLSELCYRQCKTLLNGGKLLFDLEELLSSAEFLSKITEILKSQK